MPVELIGVPPVWVDQALELEAGTDVDGMWIDGMEEVVKVLDMCLSLYSQLLIQNVILLSESRQLCLSLSLELSLGLLVHKITATKLTLKSHRLWIPEGPHIVGSGRKPSRKHGSTVRRFNKFVQTRCIHNACKIRDKAQRPSAFKSQPSGRLTYSTPELSAQFQPHQSNQKEKDHTCKACPVTCSCQNGCGNALELH